MTIKKLRETLEGLEGEYGADTEVHFSYNYGDHWRTEVALVVRHAEPLYVKHSSYHNMDKLVDEEDVDVDDRPVIVLHQ